MLYVIHAMDLMYSGLHGLEDWSIHNCDCIKDVEEIGYENSLEVINSYPSIYDTLEKDIKDYMEEDPVQTWKEEDIDNLRDTIYTEDILFDYWKIKKEIADNFSIKELEKCLLNNPKHFIEKYCEKE